MVLYSWQNAFWHNIILEALKVIFLNEKNKTLDPKYVHIFLYVKVHY